MYHAWRRRKVHTKFWSENLKDDTGIDGSVTLKLIRQKLDEGVDWIRLAPGRDELQALVKAVMSLLFP
jgi:hypothetical protein